MDSVYVAYGVQFGLMAPGICSGDGLAGRALDVGCGRRVVLYFPKSGRINYGAFEINCGDTSAGSRITYAAPARHPVDAGGFARDHYFFLPGYSRADRVGVLGVCQIPAGCLRSKFVAREL